MNYETRIAAIRSAWAIARNKGIEPRVTDHTLGLMSKDEKVRFAMIAAWKAGYRYAQRQAKREAGKGTTQ